MRNTNQSFLGGLLAVATMTLLTGCLSREQALAQETLTAQLGRAVAIEEGAREGRAPNLAAVEGLCRELAAKPTSQEWLGVAYSVGGEYAREAETWVALAAWEKMRCNTTGEQA
jgi:hypothetical protein